MSRPRRILVVLDDPADRGLAALLLRQGFPDDLVEEVPDPIAFAEALVGPAPSAVVASLRLSWADGLLLLQALRRHHPAAAAVFFDDLAGDQVAVRLQDIEGDRYLRRSSAGFLGLAAAVRLALERAEARQVAPGADPAYRELVEDAPVGLFSLSPDGQVLRANAALAGVLGVAAETELVGRPFRSLVEGAPPELDAAVAALRPLQLPEVGLRAADGEPRWASVHLWPVRDRDGAVARFDGAVQDITRYRARAPRASGPETLPPAVPTEADQLTYAVSHDLQEPLHLLARHARLLSERYGKRLDAEGERFLGHLVGNAERMQSMLDGLLEYARAGRQGQALAPVDFNRALEEALGNLRGSIEDAGAEVRHTTLPTLPADYRQIVQLFQNLVGNALKFRGADPARVIVGAREREADWRFAVKDNGIGIDPRFHQRIFAMFQRLHTTEEYPGTGVGLALCKRIVERHGGEVWVHSAPAEGATFYFTIPKQAAGSTGGAAA